MRIAVMTSNLYCRSSPRENRYNERQAFHAIDDLADDRSKSPTLLVLPAGYLATRQASQVAAIARPLLSRAVKAGIWCVVGVDVVRAGSSAKSGGKGDAVKSGSVRAAVLASGPRLRRTSLWWQRSVTGEDGRALDPDVARERRQLRVGSDVVDVLICGEVFAPAIRAEIIERPPSAVVFPAHTAQGSRHGRGAEYLRKAGIPVFRAVHAIGARTTEWLPDSSSATPRPHPKHWVPLRITEL